MPAKAAAKGHVPYLTREEARRIAIRAQLLDAHRPPDLPSVVERLTMLQLDPTAVVAPSADMIAWSRLGASYGPAHLQNATERDRTLFEVRAQPTPIEPPLAIVRPAAGLGLDLADMATWVAPGTRRGKWLQANDAFRRRVLDQLRESGPLASREIADTSTVSWQSTGWTNDRNVTQMLEFLALGGQVAVSARRGKQRLWDLAERVFPPNLTIPPVEEAHRLRADRWLRSLGIARPRAVGDAGIPAEIEGIKGVWRLDPEATAEGFEGRTAVLSPFDRLSHDRARAVDLFEFDYMLEMYKPKDKRRWGYFAMPVLHDDRLVGKIDAAAERASSTLVVHAVHMDGPLTARVSDEVDAELEALAHWLGFDRVRHE
jgi:uncharacterized protein YcaQ